MTAKKHFRQNIPNKHLRAPLEYFTVCVQCKHKSEQDLKAIMYPAYGTHHRLRIISGTEIQLTQNPSE